LYIGLSSRLFKCIAFYKQCQGFFVGFLTAFFLGGSEECFSDEARDGLFTGETAERFDFSDGKTDHKFMGAQTVFCEMFFCHAESLSKKMDKKKPPPGVEPAGAGRREEARGLRFQPFLDGRLGFIPPVGHRATVALRFKKGEDFLLIF
jgi:hypothetical protein